MSSTLTRDPTNSLPLGRLFAHLTGNELTAIGPVDAFGDPSVFARRRRETADLSRFPQQRNSRAWTEVRPTHSLLGLARVALRATTVCATRRVFERSIDFTRSRCGAASSAASPLLKRCCLTVVPALTSRPALPALPACRILQLRSPAWLQATAPEDRPQTPILLLGDPLEADACTAPSHPAPERQTTSC